MKIILASFVFASVMAGTALARTFCDVTDQRSSFGQQFSFREQVRDACEFQFLDERSGERHHPQERQPGVLG